MNAWDDSTNIQKYISDEQVNDGVDCFFVIRRLIFCCTKSKKKDRIIIVRMRGMTVRIYRNIFRMNKSMNISEEFVGNLKHMTLVCCGSQAA